jgi:putative SOS response-associated peptidase YedK
VCGRFGLGSPEFSETRFNAPPLPDIQPELFQPRFNIAPTEPVLAVAFSKRLQGTALKQMRWGLTPEWALNDKRKPRPTNLKTEDIVARPFFRRLLERKRCIIPADGFWEWLAIGKHKHPYNIGLKSGEQFGFAGLWDACRTAAGEWLVSCTILTTSPNPLVATLHDRQAVILRPEDEEPWLDPAVTDVHDLFPFLQALPESDLAMYPAVPLVNHSDLEGPALRTRMNREPTQPYWSKSSAAKRSASAYVGPYLATRSYTL